jgi:phage gpG-like protein
MLRIEISTSGDALTVLTRFRKNLPITQILDESAALLLNRIRTRFLDETKPTGGKWVKSKAAIRRRRLGLGGGTLYNTGRLFQSIQLYQFGENGRMIGTDVPYAGYHNEGTTSLPQRKFLGFSKEDMSLAQQIAIKRISEALR